ncbi:MAG: type I phosphomannose isomerase catalytic subunit [Planctomycetota bacterium]
MTIAVPLRLSPRAAEKVWGGARLAGLVSDPLDATGPVGEVWICSDREERGSVVVGGPFDGRSLRGLMLSEREALLGEAGTNAAGEFPLLVKLLEAAQDLSIQVHPDAVAAERLHGESKEECWYILHADPGAEVYVGLADGVDARRFAARAATPDVVDLLARHVVHAGDFVHVPTGTVHGIGAGITLVEVQESSDTTYRLYDWGRLGLDGKPRATHLDEALASIDYGVRPAGPVRAEFRAQVGGDSVDRAALLVDTKPFRVELLELHRGGPLGVDALPSVLVVLSGSGQLSTAATEAPLEIRAGQCWLLPADAQRARIGEASGDLTLLRAIPARLKR